MDDEQRRKFHAECDWIIKESRRLQKLFEDIGERLRKVLSRPATARTTSDRRQYDGRDF